MKVVAQTTEDARPDDVIGGRYRVVRELGRGGMGRVYEAVDLRTQRRVAVKTTRADADRRGEMLARFESEARAAGRLRHPNVVEVIDVGDDDARGVTFIVHELLDGGDLGRCLRAVKTLSPRHALATLLPVADALAAAHARGVVHCDVKPDNIFLHEGPGGVVPKVIDFGIARGADHAPTEAGGDVVGSPGYVSPEQARGDAHVDGRTDVWSLGMVLYKCLSGSVAYPASASASVLLARIICEEPIALATLAPGLPRDLVAVVQRAVTKDLAARWPSMEAFAAALRGCDAWRGVTLAQAQRWAVDARGVPQETEAEVAGAEVAVSDEAPRGDRRVHVLALVTAVLVAVAALWPGPRRSTMAHRPAAVAMHARAAVAEPATPRVTEVVTPTVAATPAVTVARVVAPRAVRRVNAASRRGAVVPVARRAAEHARGFNGALIIE